MQNSEMIQMKKIALSTSLLMTLLVVILVQLTLISALPEERVVGVEAGNWVKYGNFSAIVSPDFPLTKDYNKTEWILITVQSVSGTNITYEAIEHLENGTEQTFLDWIDIENGVNRWGMSYTFPFFISTNLQPGDSIYEGVYVYNFEGWRINETIFRTYLGVIGETNHVNVTNYDSAIFDFNLYWNKGSGVLAEFDLLQFYSDEWLKLSFKVVDSNPISLVPEFPTWTSMLLILIGLTVAIAIYKRRLLKTPIH